MENDILCLSAEFNNHYNYACVLQDLSAETVLAEINYAAAVDTENLFIYVDGVNGELIRYPLRMPEDIVKYALSGNTSE